MVWLYPTVDRRLSRHGGALLTLTAEQVRTLAPDASAARSGEALGDRRRWTGAGRIRRGRLGSLSRQRFDAIPSGRRPFRPGVQMLVPISKDPVQARARPHVPARRWRCSVRRSTRMGASVVGRPGESAAAAATRSERPAEIDPEARAKRRDAGAKGRRGDRRARSMVARSHAARSRQHPERGLPILGRDGRPARGRTSGRIGRSVRGLLLRPTPGMPGRMCCSREPDACTCLCEAYLPPGRFLADDLRADVRSLVGWNVKEEELEPAGAVVDRWLVIGQRVDDRGDIVTARTFLLGESPVGAGRATSHSAWERPRPRCWPSGPGVPGKRDLLSVLDTAARCCPSADRAGRRGNAIPNASTLARRSRSMPRASPGTRSPAPGPSSSGTSCRSCGTADSSSAMPTELRCRSSRQRSRRACSRSRGGHPIHLVAEWDGAGSGRWQHSRTVDSPPSRQTPRRSR